MRKIATSLAFVVLMSAPALAQMKQDPTASPGTGVNETQLPRNQQPSANTGASTTPTPTPPAAGTRALQPGQNPDGTPREQSPGNAPQLPGSKGQN